METKSYRIVFFKDDERFLSEAYRTKALAESVLGNYKKKYGQDCGVIKVDEPFSDVLDALR